MPQWGKIVRLHGQVSQSLSFHECFLLPLPMQSHPSLSPKYRNLRFTASFSIYLLFLYLGSCFDPFPEVNFFCVFVLFCFLSLRREMEAWPAWMFKWWLIFLFLSFSGFLLCTLATEFHNLYKQTECLVS